MSSRPRRSAAQRATVAITDLADRDAGVMSSRSRSKLPRGESSPAADSQHMHLTVKVNSSKLRQATNTGRGSTANQISVAGRASAASRRPTRGAKKRYVESESDEDEEEDEVVAVDDEEDDDEEEEEEEDDDEEEEEEEEDVIQVGEEDDEVEEEDEDAEGEVVEEEDAMDIDAEGEDEDLGEEDAEGDIDMDMTPAPQPPTIKISKPAKGSGGGGNDRARTYMGPRGSGRPATDARKAAAVLADDDDDEEELSELESDVEDEINDTVEVGGQDVVDEDADGEPEEDVDIDVDAEGEEIEVADEEEDDEGDLDSADDGSRAGTPDLTKMTRRQRARFEDTPQEYMKLSDEVQVKKHFTAEEISMRRQEMARRRRNLSEKRNEEVKTETINKLLKRQAPKNNKRGAQAGGDETPDVEAQKPDPVFIRWINSREGSRTAVPQEVLDGPAGRALHGGPNGNLGGRMVQEVT